MLFYKKICPLLLGSFLLKASALVRDDPSIYFQASKLLDLEISPVWGRYPPYMKELSTIHIVNGQKIFLIYRYDGGTLLYELKTPVVYFGPGKFSFPKLKFPNGFDEDFGKKYKSRLDWTDFTIESDILIGDSPWGIFKWKIGKRGYVLIEDIKTAPYPNDPDTYPKDIVGKWIQEDRVIHIYEKDGKFMIEIPEFDIKSEILTRKQYGSVYTEAHYYMLIKEQGVKERWVLTFDLLRKNKLRMQATPCEGNYCWRAADSRLQGFYERL